jgi:hypothetical protein
MIKQSIEEDTKQRNIQLADISRYRLYDKYQSVKLLSYHPTTAVHLHMEGGLDGLNHLVFHSIASNIMNWPFFLGFVSIDNDDEEEKEA